MGDLKVNKDYADDFMERKAREYALKRGTTAGSDFSDSESSETEDDDAQLLTDTLEQDIDQTLAMIKRKDPRIYKKDAEFYERSQHADAESHEADSTSRKKPKAMRYKDMVREQALKKVEASTTDSGSDESDSDTGDRDEERNTAPSYQEEQDALKRAFLASASASASADADGSDTDDTDDTGASGEARDEQNEVHSSDASDDDFFTVSRNNKSEAEKEQERAAQQHFERTHKRDLEAFEAAGSGGSSGFGVSAKDNDKSTGEHRNGSTNRVGTGGVSGNRVLTEADADAFLQQYIAERKWLIPDDERIGYDKDEYHRRRREEKEAAAHAELDGSEPMSDGMAAWRRGDEEEKALLQQEKFERSYNFRFEDPHGDAFKDMDVGGSSDRAQPGQIETHARTVAGSLRRDAKAERRRKERESRRQRKQEELRIKREELKRLKNIKLKEIHRQAMRITEAAGGAKPDFDAEDKDGNAVESSLRKLGIDLADLDGDFDPDAHDRKMAAAFGDDYYAAEDAQYQHTGGEAEAENADGEGVGGEGADTESQWDAEAGWQGEDDAGEAWGDEADDNAVPEQSQNQNLARGGEQAGTSEDLEAAQRNLQRKVHELHALDFEGIAGGMQTRFKYRKVKPDSFGLTAADILNADDKELTQLVSIKKLAPYRDTSWVVPVRKQQRWKKEMRGRWKNQEELARRQRTDEQQQSTEHDDKGSNDEGEKNASTSVAALEPSTVRRKRKKKGKKRPRGEAAGGEKSEGGGVDGNADTQVKQLAQPPAGKKKRKRKHGSAAAASKHNMSQARLSAYGL